MKRTLSSSVLKGQALKKDAVEDRSDDAKKPESAEASSIASTSGVKPRLGGSGSAWKAGALSDASQILTAEREQVVDRIISGRQELLIDPDQIVDIIGTDRREDWRDQEAYASLMKSIEKNGQDTPIHVWPADPSWRPDDREPENVKGIQFHLIVGRRRHAISKALGRPVRAILVPQDQRGSPEEQFEMLFMRFRENEERENLSAFERLVSIGEMFEQLRSADSGKKLTAVEFANRVGVHESMVSRGRAVFSTKDEILHACKNVYDLSHREVENLLNGLNNNGKKTAKPKSKKPKKLSVQRNIGSRKLSVTGQGGKLSVSATGLNLNEEVLNGLGDVIAEYLKTHGSK